MKEISQPEDRGLGGATAWELPEQEPTRLIALWPGPRPPSMAEVIARLRGVVKVAEGAATGDPGVLWSALLSMPGRSAQIAVWSEAAQPLTAEEAGDPGAAACRWVLGVETLLDRDRPIHDLAALIRTLRATFRAPAILDVNCDRWHPGASVDAMLGPDGEPPAGVLWIVHAVSDQRCGAWLHTHGLHRCARPELEMLEVPQRSVRTAADLLEAIAARSLEADLPDPGEPFEIGPGIEVTFQKWEEVARYLGGAPGGLCDRTDSRGDHGGVRAVVCAARQQGAYRRVWPWPQSVVESIEAGRGALYVSEYETLRHARHARRTWPVLAGTFSALGARAPQASSSVRFFIKAGLCAGAAATQREHLWFAVRGMEPDRAEAQLLNQPAHVGLRRGDVVWISRDDLSDWSVETSQGRFGPAQAGSLSEALRRLEMQFAGQVPAPLERGP